MITVKDSAGSTMNSLDYNVGKTAPPDNGGGGGGGGACPLEPAMCQIICTIMPNLPFCPKP